LLARRGTTGAASPSAQASVTATAALTETKNGEARQVYLNDAALEALKTLPPRIDGGLFPLHPNQVSLAFLRAVRRAGIEDFRLHDCRHTFASYQAMAGIQARGLQTLLGHRDGRMTARYSHLSDAYLKAAVDGVVLGRSNAGRVENASNAVANWLPDFSTRVELSLMNLARPFGFKVFLTVEAAVEAFDQLPKSRSELTHGRKSR
jgi:Phage integrase family